MLYPHSLASLLARGGLLLGLTASAWAQSNYATPYAFRTIAGIPPTPVAADGTGAAARFAGPCGIAVDSAGNIFVADTGNGTIRKVTPSGVVTTVAGTAGKLGSVDGVGSAARFRKPNGISIDESDNLYIADTDNHTIRKLTPAGVVTTIAGSGEPGSADGIGLAAQFNLPTSVAVDNHGNVYVADFGNNTIRKITTAGTVTTLAGKPDSVSFEDMPFVNGNFADGDGSEARFWQPSGVSVDGAGNLYVADSGNCLIRKITPAGRVTKLAGVVYSVALAWRAPGAHDGSADTAWFYYPCGVAVAKGGDVYVADTSNNIIRKVTATGEVTTPFGTAYHDLFPRRETPVDGTGSTVRFVAPMALAFGRDGEIYFSDSGSNTIRKITPLGAVTTIAGAIQSDGARDGAGQEARFNQPADVAVDESGDLYIADVTNSLVRKITTAGQVTTLAGHSDRSWGNEDGVGPSAGFNQPSGVAADRSGNIYVADSGNCSIRKIAPSGLVSTIAGDSQSEGSSDGVGSNAQFFHPRGIAVDITGNIYVADSDNNTIRKITRTGIVTTLAGFPGQERKSLYVPPVGSVDGTGSAARFSDPNGVAVDEAGVVYVADTGNNTIRRITPSGVVTTLAGLTTYERIDPGYSHDGTTYQITSSSVDGIGSAARFNRPSAIAIDRAGNLYVSETGNIRKIKPAGLVTTIAASTTDPSSPDGTGSGAQFNFPHGLAVDSSGNIYVADTRNNTIRKGVQVIAGNPTPFAEADRLLNISTRSLVGADTKVQIAGFTVAGTAPKQVLIRASGPALNTAFGLTGALADPVIELHDQTTGITLATNDDWDPALASSFSAVGAFPWTAGSRDSALVVTLDPGLYTVVVKEKNKGTGIALVEIYDADSGKPGSNLINISTRSLVGTDADAQIAGFVVGGPAPKKVLVRAAGPALSPLGVTGVLADPILELHNQGTGELLATVDNWDAALAADFAKVGAFPWTAGSKDAALVATLDPGLYTVVVKGKNNGTGVALVEVYEEP